jgi:putative ABC transport system permease protein
VIARPVIRAASGGVVRHRVQTVVIFMVLLVSTASATLGLALLANSDGPFQRAFSAQRGAELTAAVNPGRVTGAQLAVAGRLPEVTASAGPFPQTTAVLNVALHGPPGAAGVPNSGGGPPPGAMTYNVIGRASPGGPVDDLTITGGHWVQRPGQVVLSSNVQEGVPVVTPPLGSEVTVSSAPGQPRLTVVGYARSITGTAGAWVIPAQVTALRPAGARATAQLLYRFRTAATGAQIRSDAAALAAALPAGAIAGTSSWLTAKAQATGASAVIEPFVLAFALIGLVMSVLIVANVVSAAVVAGYRRIGVLKSIGFTPAQVVTAYLVRIGAPALAGCLLGVGLGDLLAIPVLRKSATIYQVNGQSVPVWVTVATPMLMFVLVLLAALAPALRAGRLSAIQAIATGQAPSQGRGFTIHRLAARLRLPRPVSIGLAGPFARPGRASVTLAAIALGAIAVIFAVGLDASLAQAATGQTLATTEQVQLRAGGPTTASQNRAVVTALRSLPGTRKYVAEAQPMISVAGLTGTVAAKAFVGNATWTGYQLISGHWYRGSGEVVVNTGFLIQTGLSVGDRTTISADGSPVTVRIVGSAFDPQGRGQAALLTSWQTLGGSAAGLTVSQYDIQLRPGTSVNAYANALNQALGRNSPFAAGSGSTGQFFVIAESLIAILTLMVAIAAALGVLNTVLLSTRDRVHDLGVFKAIGMTPRQMITMVLCWVLAPAVAAAMLAVPAALLLHAATINAMGSAAYTGISPQIMDVYRPAGIALLALSALAIAAFGGLLPASWAAKARTAVALRTE